MGGSKPCDVSRILESGFGEGYAYLKRSSTLLNEEFRGANIQYEVRPVPQPVSCSHFVFCLLWMEHKLRVFLQKLVGARQAKKLHIFCEKKTGSLPWLKQPASKPYPELNEPSHTHADTYILKTLLSIIISATLVSYLRVLHLKFIRVSHDSHWL